MPNEVKFEFTITKEAVEAFAALLANLFPLNGEREGKCAKEEKEVNSPIPNPVVLPIGSTNSSNTNNNNIIFKEPVEPNDVVEVNDVVSKNDNVGLSTIEPSLGDIRNYIMEKNYELNAERFYYYYKNNNWKTKKGNSIINLWQTYVDDWARNQYSNKTENKSVTPNKVGLGTAEERRKAHPFVPTDFEALSIRNRGNSSDEEESYDSCAG